jgi:hypothetical protein
VKTRLHLFVTHWKTRFVDAGKYTKENAPSSMVPHHFTWPPLPNSTASSSDRFHAMFLDSTVSCFVEVEHRCAGGPGRWLWSVFGVVVNKLDPRTQSHDEVLKSFCTGNLQWLGTSVRASRSMASAVISQHRCTEV